MGIREAIRKVIPYLGSILFLVAMIMTVLVDVSTPINHSIYFLKWIAMVDGVENEDRGMIQYGVFGNCWAVPEGLDCRFSKEVGFMGYHPTQALVNGNAARFDGDDDDAIRNLTIAFLLHPLGTGLLFITSFLSLIAVTSPLCSFLATTAASITFTINAAAAIVDWIVFSRIRDTIVASQSITNSDVPVYVAGEAKYGSAIFLSLFAAVIALAGTVTTFISCRYSRRKILYQNRYARRDR